jgi:hypothetical protein
MKSKQQKNDRIHVPKPFTHILPPTTYTPNRTPMSLFRFLTLNITGEKGVFSHI